MYSGWLLELHAREGCCQRPCRLSRLFDKKPREKDVDAMNGECMASWVKNGQGEGVEDEERKTDRLATQPGVRCARCILRPSFLSFLVNTNRSSIVREGALPALGTKVENDFVPSPPKFILPSPLYVSFQRRQTLLVPFNKFVRHLRCYFRWPGR